MKGATSVRIRFLGIFPSFMDLCCRKAPDPLSLAGEHEALQEFHKEQMSEYPPDILENQRVVESLFERLLEDFPRGIAIEVVGLDTFRGMYYSWKHRVRGNFAIVVDDDRRFGRDVSYDALKAAVQDALRVKGFA